MWKLSKIINGIGFWFFRLFVGYENLERINNMRGDGKTSRQMQEAPKGAIFIWCTSDLWYPKHLAIALERKDLKIVRPEWLDGDEWRGLHYSEIIVDHWARLTTKQWDKFNIIKGKITNDTV